jgi:hypothetical protein
MQENTIPNFLAYFILPQSSLLEVGTDWVYQTHIALTLQSIMWVSAGKIMPKK